MATSTTKAAKPQGSGAADAPDMTRQDLEADIARLKDDLAKLASQFASLGEQSVHTARRAASEGVEQLKARGEAKYAELKSSAHDVEEQLASAVREKPITSLAIAAGVGFLFAMLTRR